MQRGDKIAQVHVRGRVTFTVEFRRDVSEAPTEGGLEAQVSWIEQQVDAAIRDKADSVIDWSGLEVRFIPESQVVKFGEGY